MTFLERYKNGEYIQVWQEMYDLGDIGINHPQYDDVVAVVIETMRRVRHNVEILHQRLKTMNYRFVEPSRAYSPPSNNIDEQVERLDKIIGGIPLALKYCYTIVGEVDFRGSHPKLANYHYDGNLTHFKPHDNNDNFPYYADPLMFDGIESSIEWAEDTKEIVTNGELFETPNWLCLPDWYHKAGVSGGTYDFTLPSRRVDTKLKNEPHDTTLVDYLRIAFKWGGFPGYHLHTADEFDVWREKQLIRSTYEDVPIPYAELKSLTEGLLGI